jgi:replicative DNA helicase
MVINKVSRYKNQENEKINLTLDISMLNSLCRYVLQNNAYLRMEHLVNLRRVMNLLDLSVYQNDQEKMKRLNFINKALSARLDNNINDRDLILTYVNGGLTFKVDFLDYDHIDLSTDEIIYIHGLISETLQYQFMFDAADKLIDIGTKFKTSDFSTRGDIVKETEEIIADLQNKFRKSKTEDNVIDMTFSLRDGEFENAVTNTWNLVTNPSRKLITGMQGINEMTGGGFESGRVYMLIGSSGVGKSLTLLNLIYQIKRYNTNYKTKDPTKTPCIVLLTMENTVVETITRLFDLVIENSIGMENYNVQDVINMLRNEGELRLDYSSPIDIVIKYKANKSVNTSYLYTICDDLEDKGYEVICLVQDHIKRIRSIDHNTDLRLELGDIVNEFKTFAAYKDIPVITNTHVNRDATRAIEETARKGNQDVGKVLGKSSIGESMLMIDNLDCGMIITLDFDKDANRYMTFNLIKYRTKNQADRTYIAQPFVPGSTIRLLEDVGGIPQFKESLHNDPMINRGNGIVKMNSASGMIGNLSEVINVTKDDIDSNAFSKQSYSMDLDHQAHNSRPPAIKPISFVPDSLISSKISDLKLELGLE